MKEKKEITGRNPRDLLRGTASVVRNDGSLGLCRGWDDILVSILDRRVEKIFERELEENMAVAVASPGG